MQEYIVNRPDEAAMKRILNRESGSAAGAIIRLAWQAGLLRDEITRLTWAQIDFSHGEIHLPDRIVPLPEELCSWLEDLREHRNCCSDVVVLSDRDQKPLTPQSISRLTRAALDREGQVEVRLIDLRHDYILRQLMHQDWQHVSRITGVEAAALQAHFAAYLPEQKVSTRVRRDTPTEIDEFALWKLLETEYDSPAGVTLWLTWQGGLQLDEIVDLRWNQVDFDAECLHLAERDVSLNGGALEVLRSLRDKAAPEAEHVLLAPRSGKPYDRTRLSKLARTALVRHGVDDVTLRDLRLDYDLRVGGERQVLIYVRAHRSIGRNELAELLGISGSAAYHRLKQMCRRGKLTQVGSRYYLQGTVIPPERHEGAVLAYLNHEGLAYRQDIADLLGIEARQCRAVLKRLVEEGKIIQERQQYHLPDR